LQAAGVTAAPLHDELDALADQQLAARDWFREIEMPTVGTHRYPGYLFKMRNTPDDIRLPPPLLGEHNEEVYLEIMGYSREQYEALVRQGLVGTTYSADILP
jgi:crotonobetainyl-CoA:carnitine CoA-transferase CaiB-like acyl-CoA transferase